MLHAAVGDLLCDQPRLTRTPADARGSLQSKRVSAAQFSLARKKDSKAADGAATAEGPGSTRPSDEQQHTVPAGDEDARFARQESQRMLEAMSSEEVRGRRSHNLVQAQCCVRMRIYRVLFQGLPMDVAADICSM